MICNKIRKEFPILNKKIGNHSLVYFDNAATTHKPISVLQATYDYATTHNGNPHRGAHILSIAASEAYENSKQVVKEFINAKDTDEIIYTRNATESLNLIATSYAEHTLKKGDRILITIAEHHSNLVIWQRVAEKTGAILDYIYVDKETGKFYEADLAKLDDPRIKIFSFAQVSNVLGLHFDSRTLIQRAHAHGAVVIVDGAQSIPHKLTDVQDLNCDFYVFSGHKMCASTGIGVLYAKRELLEKMPPFLLGGDMIEQVEEQKTTFASLPAKFEAGTPNVEGAVSLAAAIHFLNGIGYDFIQKQEKQLTHRCLSGMKKIPFVHIVGSTDIELKEGLIAFTVEGVHPEDVAQILSSDGICIRTGHHCAEPLHLYLQIPSTCRVSFYLYNTELEVDYFLEKLSQVRKIMGYND